MRALQIDLCHCRLWAAQKPCYIGVGCWTPGATPVFDRIDHRIARQAAGERNRDASQATSSRGRWSDAASCRPSGRTSIWVRCGMRSCGPTAEPASCCTNCNRRSLALWPAGQHAPVHANLSPPNQSLLLTRVPLDPASNAPRSASHAACARVFMFTSIVTGNPCSGNTTLPTELDHRGGTCRVTRLCTGPVSGRDVGSQTRHGTRESARRARGRWIIAESWSRELVFLADICTLDAMNGLYGIDAGATSVPINRRGLLCAG
jgi:hypothetical protein